MRNFYTKVVLLLIVGLTPAVGFGQSNVPIDSARGNFEGAENIHWYQQKALRVSDNDGLLPSSGQAFFCNEENLAFDCFGSLQARSQPSYFAQGVVPVVITVIVDTRATEGFDFPFRRGIDAVRRANDTFARSGIAARFFVSRVRTFDFDDNGFSFDAFEIVRKLLIEEASFLDSVSEEDQADIIMFVRNTEGENSDVCGAATIGVLDPLQFIPPVAVLSCEDKFRQENSLSAQMVSSHELGHVFGLDHPRGQGESSPHLDFGLGYISSATGASTIMDGLGTITAPYFSSPNLLDRGEFLGEDESVDAARAANQSATSVSLYWELRFNDRRQSTLGVGTSATNDRGYQPGPIASEKPRERTISP